MNNGSNSAHQGRTRTRDSRVTNRLEASADPTKRIQMLLHELVACILDMPQPSTTDAQPVMLDAEVQGVRCLLIQSAGNAERAPVVLSPREREIVRMVAAGYPNKMIAGVLDISCWTVGTHLRRVFAKLGVGSRAAMVARLFEHGALAEPSVADITPVSTSLDAPPLRPLNTTPLDVASAGGVSRSAAQSARRRTPSSPATCGVRSAGVARRPMTAAHRLQR